MRANAEKSAAARLEKPVRITEQVWPEGTVPVVTIKCITYQHVNFIRDAIEGFLMQETTFPVEILIHDDASTDGTADIVREYQAKYPQLIRTVLQTENQYSQGNKPGKFLNPLIRGEFVALCEGDDYWTDPHKLGKQVKLLEEHPEISGVFHWANELLTAGQSAPLLRSSEKNWLRSRLTVKDVLEDNVIATCSVVYRKSLRPVLSAEYNKLPMGDWPLWIHLALKGPLVCVPKRMAVYRHHSGGVWSTKSFAKQQVVAAQLFPILWKDLPLHLRGAMLKGFATLIQLAAARGGSIAEDEDLRQFIQRRRQEMLADGLPDDLPPELGEVLEENIQKEAILSVLDNANKAWEAQNFDKARRLYGLLAFGKPKSFPARLRYALVCAGPIALALKSFWSKWRKRFRQPAALPDQ